MRRETFCNPTLADITCSRIRDTTCNHKWLILVSILISGLKIAHKSWYQSLYWNYFSEALWSTCIFLQRCHREHSKFPENLRRGSPPPTVWSFFVFQCGIVCSGAYFRGYFHIFLDIICVFNWVLGTYCHIVIWKKEKKKKASLFLEKSGNPEISGNVASLFLGVVYSCLQLWWVVAVTIGRSGGVGVEAKGKCAPQQIGSAVVTPLRKAASYEQRKKNLGNQNFWRRIIT